MKMSNVWFIFIINGIRVKMGGVFINNNVWVLKFDIMIVIG